MAGSVFVRTVKEINNGEPMNSIIITLLLATSLLACPPVDNYPRVETVCGVFHPSGQQCIWDEETNTYHTAPTDTTWYVAKVRKYLKQLDAGEIEAIDFGEYLLQVGMLMEMRDTLAKMVRCAELKHAIENDIFKNIDTPNNRYWKQELRKLKEGR